MNANHRAPPPALSAPADPAAMLEAMLQASEDLIVVVDRDYRVQFVNRTSDAAEAAASVIGQSIFTFTLGDSSDRLKTAIDAVFHTGERQTLEARARDLQGGVHDFRVHAAAIVANGTRTAVVITGEDITDLKRSESQLQRDQWVLRRLLEIQEKERQLISYEIHDGLAQYVASAIMHLEAAAHAHPDSRELTDGIRLVRAAAEEARRLIGGLRPPALDELGIVDAIESLVADARLEVPSITFEHRLPDDRLPPDVETTIFRIVQESLSNVRKHAAARKAEVQMIWQPEGIRVRVHDNGRGFDPSQVPTTRFGLEGIRQRCRLLGIEPTITSAPRKGTTVEVLLPVDASTG